MKVEVAVLGSPSRDKPTVSVDVKQHPTNPRKINLGTTSLHFTRPLTCRQLVHWIQFNAAIRPQTPYGK